MSTKYLTPCINEYSRYSDTVAVLLAIYQMFLKNPGIARFVGVEYKLKKNKGNFVKPDLVAQYDQNSKGMLFEVKWSLPFDKELLEKKLKGLKKYKDVFTNWKTSDGRVQKHDLVLICHIDDAKRAVDAVKELGTESDCKFMQQEGFSIWGWILNPAKRNRKEELRFLHCYGKTGNLELEKMIHATGGIVVPEEVLKYLRYLFSFIPEKPPVQYTIAVLVQNIFPSFQKSVEKELYELDIDLLYERAKSFFPSWQLFDSDTIQVKRRWISEAIEKLCDLGLAERVVTSPNRWSIPIPTLHPRGSLIESICKKIAKKLTKKKYKGRIPRIRVLKAFRKGKLPRGQTSIDRF
jgi:hypothetical protein